MNDSGAISGSPTVSVVFTSWNCRSRLPLVVAGIEAQAVPGMEVIAIDDGSSDGSVEWLLAKSRTASWLSVIETCGIGPNAARNRGIAAARAPLVAFLDATDVWLPGKLAAQIAFHLADPEVTFSFTDCAQVDGRGKIRGTLFERWPAFRRVATQGASAGYRRLDRAPARLLAEGMVATSTVVARRDRVVQLAGFDESLRFAVDRDLWLRLARTGPVGFASACGVRHRPPPTGAAGEARFRIACMRRLLAVHAPAVVVEPGGAAAVRRARAHILAAEADLARAEGRHRAAAMARFGALRRLPSACLAVALGRDLASAFAHRFLSVPVPANGFSVGGRG